MNVLKVGEIFRVFSSLCEEENLRKKTIKLQYVKFSISPSFPFFLPSYPLSFFLSLDKVCSYN